MEFLLDHDVPDEIGTALEREGHRVWRLREVLPITAGDEQVLREACDRSCLLITCNVTDFVTLVRAEFAEGRKISGLILLERRRSRQMECANVLRLIADRGETISGQVNFA